MLAIWSNGKCTIRRFLTTFAKEGVDYLDPNIQNIFATRNLRDILTSSKSIWVEMARDVPTLPQSLSAEKNHIRRQMENEGKSHVESLKSFKFFV